MPTGTGFIDDVLTWFRKPFNSSGSALNWILFVGLLSIAVWMWSRILHSIHGE